MKLNHYKLLIQYKGTHYSGWQVQAQGEKTIQGELISILEQMNKSDHAVKVLGSGRTDAGVHAIGQVVKVDMPLFIPASSLLKALNSQLPVDIQVIDIEVCEESFHPIYSAKNKEYLYIFSNEKVSPFSREFVSEYTYQLDFELMAKGAKLFEGFHDFSQYYTKGTPVSSTQREIFSSSLQSMGNVAFLGMSLVHENIWVYKVCGTGFLKQMVRLMVGTLWNLGRGKISLEEIKRSLNEGPGGKIGFVAPPQGLYLNRVTY